MCRSVDSVPFLRELLTYTYYRLTSLPSDRLLPNGRLSVRSSTPAWSKVAAQVAPGFASLAHAKEAVLSAITSANMHGTG